MNFNSVSEVENSLSNQNVPFMRPSSVQADPTAVSMDPMHPPVVPYNEDEPSLIADLALAPIRGGLNAVESVADLVTLGNVPEGTINRLGHSKTMAGSLLENGTEFMVGFTPGFGWLNRASKLGKLAKLGKVGNFIAKSNVAKGAIAGALADFSVFDEHQQRLSNLIESVPELQNPVTNYLQSKDDDSVFEGRMKNALEGLLVGGAVDGIIHGVKALKGAKQAVEAGRTAEGAKILDDAGNFISDNLNKETKNVELADQTNQIKDPLALTIIKPKEEEVVKFEVNKPDGSVETKDMRVAEFLGQMDNTTKLYNILEKDDATIGELRTALLGTESRPIIDILNHTGAVGTNKSVTAVVELFKNRLMEKNYVPKEQALADEIENLKVMGGEKWLQDISARIKNTKELGSMVMGMKFARLDVLKQLGDISERTLLAKEALNQNPYDDVARAQYRQGVIDTNQLFPAIQQILFGYNDLKSNLGRGLAMVKHTEKDARMAEMLFGHEKWAKNTQNMGQLETAVLEHLGDGDVKAGADNFEEALRRLSTLYKKYGEDGLTRMAPDKFWWKLHNEWWINALLSGTKTAFTNSIGNALSTAWKPFESALGAQWASMRAKDPAVARSFKEMRNGFLSQYGLMFDSAKEALVSANNAFKTGESSLVQNRTAVEQFQEIITKENFEAKIKEFEMKHPDAPSMLTGIAKFIATNVAEDAGKVIRLPTKALMWMDEFTKHLNFRSSAKARAMIESFDEGSKMVAEGIISQDQLDAFVANRTAEKMDNVIMEGGGLYSQKAVRMRGALEGRRNGFVGEDLNDYITEYMKKNYDEGKTNLAKYGYNWAEEATFTKKGEKGTIQATIERAVKDHPSLRFVVPFVTTPTNILKFFGQRAFGILAPLEGITRGFEEGAPELAKAHLQLTKELYSADPFIRAQAQGKIAMGVSAMTSIIGLYANGNITGQGAKDDKERMLQQATGWQPYSFKFKGADGKDTYVSYQRFDPLATFLGVVADFGDKINEDKNKGKDWLNFVGGAIAVAVSKNITSKSYLTGIEQIMDALNQPDRKMQQFISTRLGSLVVPSAVSQFAPEADPYMREARTLLDIFSKKIPGATNFLDPKRNILGEAIERPQAVGPEFASPLYISKAKNDKVMDELALLKHSFSAPPVVESGGVDLSKYQNAKGQSAYDRYLELTGQVTIGRKSLRDALTKLIKSPQYQALPDDSVEGLDSPRISEIKRVLAQYRAKAKDSMLKEFPELIQHREMRDKLVLARKQGKIAEAQTILNELNME